MKKTEWFPAWLDPVRSGLYEVDRPAIANTDTLIWTEYGWIYPETSVFHGMYAAMGRGDKWRGLTEPHDA
jgi:hypothetical protein